MRRVYGMKVARITRGGLLSRTGRNPGAGWPGDRLPDVRQKSAEAIRAGLTARQRAEHVVTDRSRQFR